MAPPTPAPVSRALGLLLPCACALLALLQPSEGHAYMLFPPFRGMAKTTDEYLRSAYNGLKGFAPPGLPPMPTDSVCGDGGQSTTQGSPAYWTFGQRGQATVLQAGSVVNIVIRQRVWHGGRFEFRVCKYSGAETTATLNQACLDRIILQPAPQQSYNRIIPGQPWWWVGELTSLQDFTMQYIVPSDLSCDGVSTFCVLQFTYVTGNSCNPTNCSTSPPASCKPAGWFSDCTLSPPTGEYFRNCADIIVQGGNPSQSPPPKVAPNPPGNVAPNPPSPTPPATPTGGDCCSQFASGMHQNPANCAQFCTCVNYKAVALQSCASGLMFNEKAQVCDWPQNVQCKGPSPVPTPIVSSPPPTVVKSSPPPPAFVNKPPLPVTSTPPPPASTDCCAAFSSGLHQNPANCAQYCTCSNFKTLSIQSCANGLMFNDNTQVCDWPQNVQCKGPGPGPVPSPVTSSPPPPVPSPVTPSPGPSTDCCASFSSGLHQNPANCAQYCICSNFKTLSIQSCANGLVFNDNAQVCDWPQNVQCKGPGPGPVPTPVTSSPPPPNTKPGPPPSPGSSTFQVNAVYTNDWSQYRSSGRPSWCTPYAYTPSSLDPSLYTHVFYAFAKIMPDFTVAGTEWNDDTLIQQIPAGPVKMISIGGWSFSRADGVFVGKGTDQIFPSIAASASNRATFIASAINYAKSRGMGGIDIDWEYPNYQGQNPRERTDFTALLRDMYPACKQAGLLLTAAVRAVGAAQNYELSEIYKYLDWLNVMAYDFNGGGFSNINKPHAPIVDCQSRACGKPWDISQGLSEYKAAGVPGSKLVLGLATYGRSFGLNTPGGNPAPGTMTTTGIAPQGDCTLDNVGGYLAWYEIKRLGLQATIDGPGMAAYSTFGPNKQYWVGYETAETLKRKVCWASSQGLLGTMAWDHNSDDNQELLRAVKAAWNSPASCTISQPDACPAQATYAPCT